MKKAMKCPDSEFLIIYHYNSGRYDIFYKRGKQISIYRHEAQALHRLINNPGRAIITAHAFEMYSFAIHVRISHGRIIEHKQRAVEAYS